jgi:hypothetical protein
MSTTRNSSRLPAPNPLKLTPHVEFYEQFSPVARASWRLFTLPGVQNCAERLSPSTMPIHRGQWKCWWTRRAVKNKATERAILALTIKKAACAPRHSFTEHENTAVALRSLDDVTRHSVVQDTELESHIDKKSPTLFCASRAGVHKGAVFSRRRSGARWVWCERRMNKINRCHSR